MSGSEDECPVCGGPIVTGRHAVAHGYDGPKHERASDCVRFVRDALAEEKRRRQEAENELSDLLLVFRKTQGKTITDLLRARSTWR